MKTPSRMARLNEALGKIDDAITELENLQTEMQNWADNMSGTNLENTGKYQQVEEVASLLEDGISELQSGRDNLGEVKFPLNKRREK